MSCHHEHHSNKQAANVSKNSMQTLYTCPMHPQIQQYGPGNCPICGMTLEPKEISADTGETPELNKMLQRFWISLVLTVPLLVLAMGGHFVNMFSMSKTAFMWLQFTLATPVVLWGGWPFFERAWQSLEQRSLNMFTLIGLGIAVAYGYSLIVTIFFSGLNNWFSNALPVFEVYYEAAAVIITLVLLGQIFELKARSQTSLAIRQLLKLVPETAHVIRAEGKEEDIPVSQVNSGDRLRIKPGDKVPVDGILLEGQSSVDQAMITGESVPIEKSMGDAVIGGTINQKGAFIMRAEHVGSDTVLSQIISMVTTAQRSRAPIQKIADSVAAYFVPAVILIAIITAICWYLFGPEPKIGYALLTSVAVLIIACPCALGLATPMSIMVGMGRAAQEGVLIKNAEALEVLEKVDTLVVDKTGTLTEGKPKVQKIIPLTNIKETELLFFAASLEKNSEHSLADAILKAAKAKNIILVEANDFVSLSGQGVKGVINDKEIAFGNIGLMQYLKVDTSERQTQIDDYRKQWHTVMFLAIDNKLAGIITVADTIKLSTKETIEALQKLNIEIIMLTGDNQVTAISIAKQLGITQVKAEVMPESKYQFISELQKSGKKVAMAGDGVNDAPALMQADVGIAMGTGTDVAIESAGITLMSGDLKGILRARKLSCAIMRNIRQNLFLAFFYNSLAIPVAAGIFYPAFGLLLNPMIASAAMSLSSVSVILNSLRLNEK